MQFSITLLQYTLKEKPVEIKFYFTPILKLANVRCGNVDHMDTVGNTVSKITHNKKKQKGNTKNLCYFVLTTDRPQTDRFNLTK